MTTQMKMSGLWRPERDELLQRSILLAEHNNDMLKEQHERAVGAALAYPITGAEANRRLTRLLGTSRTLHGASGPVHEGPAWVVPRQTRFDPDLWRACTEWSDDPEDWGPQLMEAFKKRRSLSTNRITVMALVGGRQPALELLGDGTHRLITAALLGLPRVPVTLQVHRYDVRRARVG